ncbi:MAG: hypothetical protein MZU97_01875 [Bacillus subtilis]|nr:hypothetical protein [Bacillus subtilis]
MRLDGVIGDILSSELSNLKEIKDSLELNVDFQPVVSVIEQLDSKINSLDKTSNENFNSGFAQMNNELNLFQEKLNLSLNNLLRPIKEELDFI